MVVQGKNICESCFSSLDSDRCGCCGFCLEEYSPDPTLLAVGSMLQNRYRIGGIIGKGGFGVTYIAFDTKLERRIAVKEYFPYGLALRSTGSESVMTMGDDEIFRKGAEKFYDEAKIIAKFNSSGNIVNVYDVFYENDTVYYTMEYLRGQTLKSYVENGGRLTCGQAVYVAQEIADALSFAHEMNVLHRDITPDNMMFCTDGKIKLIDFGAARQVVSEYSQTLSVILTQGFAPFEQYQKKGKQGPWTDIYSLGASLYYGLTGEVPDDPVTRLDDDQIIQDNHHSIDSELWSIIKKSIEVKAADRYQNIEELKAALSELSIRPENIVIPKSAVKIKTAAMRTCARKETLQPVPDMTAPVSQSSQSKTMPVNNASQMKTVPVNNASQMKTMPANDASQIKTMPANEVPQNQTGIYESHDKPKKKKLIPIITGAASGLVLLAVILVFALNGKGDDSEISTKKGNTAAFPVFETEETQETVEAEDVEGRGKGGGAGGPQKPVSTFESSETSAEDPSEPTVSPTSSEKPDKTPAETTPKPTPSPTPSEKPDKTPAETTPKPTPSPAPSEKPDKTPAVTTPKPAVTKTDTPKEVKIGNKTYPTDSTEIYVTGTLEDSDFENLKCMTKLTKLYLTYYKITDISFVKDLPCLQELYLGNNNISDISALKGLSNIKVLDLNHNNITDISVLKSLSNLKSLDVSFNKITDISPIKGLTKLENLDLALNHDLSDISAIKGLKNLKELSISGDEVSNISVVKNLSKLEVFDGANNPFSNVSVFKGNKTIKEISISGTKVKDISPLAGCTNITKIDLGSCKIGSISALKNMNDLEEVDLFLCGISDLSALSGKKKLTELNIGCNIITDVSPLKGCVNLDDLWIMFNEISESSIDCFIESFDGLTIKSTLKLKKNGLTKKQADRIAKLIKGKPKIDID